MSNRPERIFQDEVCQPFFLQGTGRKGKQHGVLLLHGFTGSAAHMRPLGEALHARGFTVRGINLPGHATDMDDMARYHWDDWLNAAKDAFLQLKERCDLVSVAGLSMGGCLTLILAEQMQPAAIAAISAPMGTQAPLWAARLASPFIRTIWWRQRDKQGNPIEAEPKAAPVDDRYDYGYPGFRTICGTQLQTLIRMARRDLHAIHCPMLVVQSRADETITPESAKIILQGTSSAQKGVLWLTDAPHVCAISKDTQRIAEALAECFELAEGMT